MSSISFGLTLAFLVARQFSWAHKEEMRRADACRYPRGSPKAMTVREALDRS